MTLNIAVQQAGSLLEVVLEDNGIGMDDEQLARCGTAFYSTKPDGLGIGLALSRRILEHHGGQLLLGRAESGPGLRVTLRLPQAAAPG